MVPTAGLVAELETSGFERLKVVARGVDASRFHPSRRSQELRSSWGAGPSTLVVVAVGRVAPEKNLDLLVSAFRKIRTVQPDARLVVVGDGPSRVWLETETPDAVFAGRRLGEDLAAHYASADLLLFPSLTETFGNVTLEAMASGVAVLAFDYGAAGQSVVSGVHGWTVPYGDRSAFERAAECAVADWPHLRKLGSQGRQVAETMAWTEIVAEVLSIYSEAARSVRFRGLQT
jgi:glycosyltransferase involved in cell wall biosynthesis